MRRSLLQSNSFEYWESQADTVRQYWGIYGGFPALLKSPYLFVSVCLTLVCLAFWSVNEKGEYLVKASDLAVSAIPNLLGFTVGALAIVLAFSSATIFKLLAEEGDPQSYFMKLTSNLVHFILVQVVALICGLIAKVTDSRALDVVTLFFLFYAILVTFSTALQLFLTAQVYNAHTSLKGDDE